MTTHRTIVPLLLVAACAGSGGGESNAPIDARGLPPELIVCRSRIEQEHNLTDVVYRRLDGLGERKLASRPGQESGVRVHPIDPMRIAFVRQRRSDDPSSREVFVSSLDGSTVERQITRDGDDDQWPTWLADGQRIAFTSNRSGRFQLWTVAADGDPDARPLVDGPPDSHDLWPDARDGAVVFTRVVRAGSAFRAELWRIDESGANPERLTDGGGVSGGDDPLLAPGDHQPCWSPSRGQVAFVRDGRLHLLDGASRAVTDLAPTGVVVDDAMPRFAPQGYPLLLRREAVASGLRGGRLLAVNGDGQELALLDLDSLYTESGFDVTADFRAWLDPTDPPVEGDLADRDVDILLGSRARGNGEDLRRINGTGVEVATAPFNGKEAAGLRLGFRLPVADAKDVLRLRLRAAVAIGRIGEDVRLRVSVKNYVRNRYEVAWELRPLSTTLQDVELTFDSLAHVDRKGNVRVEVGCELPEDAPAVLALDGVVIEAWTR